MRLRRAKRGLMVKEESCTPGELGGGWGEGSSVSTNTGSITSQEKSINREATKNHKEANWHGISVKGSRFLEEVPSSSASSRSQKTCLKYAPKVLQGKTLHGRRAAAGPFPQRRFPAASKRPLWGGNILSAKEESRQNCLWEIPERLKTNLFERDGMRNQRGRKERKFGLC